MADTRYGEPPLRFLGQLAGSDAEQVCDAMGVVVEDHEDRMHIPPKRTEPLQAIPFADERIPDVHMAAMIERVETERTSLEEVAAAWGYPPSLVQRAFADFQPQWRKFIADRASGCMWKGRR